MKLFIIIYIKINKPYIRDLDLEKGWFISFSLTNPRAPIRYFNPGVCGGGGGGGRGVTEVSILYPKNPNFRIIYLSTQKTPIF